MINDPKCASMQKLFQFGFKKCPDGSVALQVADKNSTGGGTGGGPLELCYEVCGKQTLTADTTAAAAFTGLPAGTTTALISVEGCGRFCLDGSVPTSTAGHLLAPGAIFGLGLGYKGKPTELSGFQIIGTPLVTIQATFYKLSEA